MAVFGQYGEGAAEGFLGPGVRSGPGSGGLGGWGFLGPIPITAESLEWVCACVKHRKYALVVLECMFVLRVRCAGVLKKKRTAVPID